MPIPQIYILYSEKTDRYYIGSTHDLDRRIDEHQRGNTPSTKSGRPWVIAFTQRLPSLKEARQQESRIKRWKNRKLIERIITSQHLSIG